MAELEQYVNLEKKATFVEDEVKSLERAGELHVECTMKKGMSPNLLKVRLTPIAEPQTYSAAEKGRNTRFKLVRTRAPTVISAKKFKLEEDIQLPAAGGNKYKVEAKVLGKVVESAKKLITWRKIYYQAVHMVGVTVPSTATMVTDYAAHFIRFKEKDPAGTAPYLVNTDSDTVAQRNNIVQTAANGYTLSRYEPYTVCVFFVNMIANPQAGFVIAPAATPAQALGPGIFNWSGSDVTFTLPDKYLWWGINPTEDAKNGGHGNWLTPGSAYYVGADGVHHPLDDTDITVDTTQRVSGLGGYDTVKVHLPWSARNFWSSNTVRFGMTLKVVKGFSGGYSEPNVNLITIATSAWWRPYTDAKRLQILNHEMGHKIGMLPDGTGKKLDKPGSHYTDKGHQGPHCSNGAVYNAALATPWQGLPTCVMFGATSCFSPATGAHQAAPSAYCPDCQKLVKKLDLFAADLPGLKNSVKLGHI
jgi:type VI secretion system secreted protein VgrG